MDRQFSFLQLFVLMTFSEQVFTFKASLPLKLYVQTNL